MSKMLFTIYEDSILIDNITLIKEFNDTLFRIDVNNIPYEISGQELVLNQVTNDNKSIKITGQILSVKTETNKPKEKVKFIKKLLS
jgi:hypothetical protein